MPTIRDNAEVLRALGRFLDDQGATTFEIVNEIPYLDVTWEAPGAGSQPGRRAYQEPDLYDLRAEARALRQGAGRPVGSLVELLRTIGQELDRDGVELGSLRRDARAFHVSGARAGGHHRSDYRTKDLVTIAAARRSDRGKAHAAPPLARPVDAPNAYFGIIVGARVYTEDGEFIGEVVDIRNRHFKVAQTSGEEACWLPAQSVGAITRSGHVVLSPIG